MTLVSAKRKDDNGKPDKINELIMKVQVILKERHDNM